MPGDKNVFIPSCTNFVSSKLRDVNSNTFRQDVLAKFTYTTKNLTTLSGLMLPGFNFKDNFSIFRADLLSGMINFIKFRVDYISQSESAKQHKKP